MPERPPPRTLRERFPVLSRLELRGSEIPFVAQMTVTDCGAAAVAMVLAHYGKHVPLERIRNVIGVGRGGSTATSLLDGATWFGLRGRAVSLDVDDLPVLSRGSILHWQFRHWVVFDRIGDGVVHIVDPANGHRNVSMRDFRRNFTGIALSFEPGAAFEKEARPRWAGLGRYFARLLRHSRLITRIVVMSFVLRLLAMALPLVTGMMVDRIIPRGDYGLFQVVAGGLGVIVLFNFVSSLIRAQLNLHLRTNVDAEMTLDFVHHLVDLPYEYFQLRPPGDLMVRLSSNARVREILTSGVLSALLDGSLACIYLVILIASSPLLGFVVAALGAARVAVLISVRHRQRELQALSIEMQGRSTGFQMEMLNAMEVLKGLGIEQRAAEQYSNIYVANLNVDLDQGRLSAKLEAIMGAFDTLAPLAVLWLGTHAVMTNAISLGTMLALCALAAAFLAPVSNLITSLSNWQLLSSYIERINDVFDSPREQSDVDGRPAPTLSGGIRLEDVSFRYASNGPLCVANASLEVRPGECIAIVGPSGSGKTTLGRLIVGLFKPSSGKLFFDDIDADTLNLRSIRRQFGVVTQNAVALTGTLKQNIAYGREDLSLEAIQSAAKLAVLHDDITAMPLGYDTPILGNGSSLSGGQRQRLALARALARKPPILLLDEATSSLDAVTEHHVQQALATLRCTRIVIAHRLSTIRDADRILVMDRGAIAECGTHGDLLARRGLYAGLVGAQLAS